MSKAEESKSAPRPELVFGLVGAIGADVALLEHALSDALGEVTYPVTPIRMSSLLEQFERWENLPKSPEDVRIEAYMDAGDQLREVTGRGDALALGSVAAIREQREALTGSVEKPDGPRAFVLRSLKHRDELKTLREIYGARFSLVAAYSPRERRVDNLAQMIANSHGDFRTDGYREAAEGLIERDYSDRESEFGQQVEGVFHQADFFVDVSKPDTVRSETRRFVELLFGHSFHTPTPDEFAMFIAKAASLRSSDMGRQVGAVITTGRADIAAVGSNEVPRAGGGQYWPGDVPDGRDFWIGEDANDAMKRIVVADVLRRLGEADWLSDEARRVEPEELLARAVDEAGPLGSGHVMNLIEFVRAVHAEMGAMLDAARRGVSIEGGILYSTTFPCHDCCRHIVGAGISQVVYVEPYPKSLGLKLFSDSLHMEGAPGAAKVVFRPFVGVGPRVYESLFTMEKGSRKDAAGRRKDWQAVDAQPRLIRYQTPTYLVREAGALKEVGDRFEELGLKLVV